MRIAVNARMLTQRKPGGLVTYAHETLTRITRRHREHEFLFIVDRPFPGRAGYPANVSAATAFPSFHPLLWYPWFEMAVPGMLKKFGADLFLSPDGFASLSAEVPTVAVIHDVNFHHHPQDLPFLTRRYYNRYFPLYAKKAATIATVSEYSRRDIVNCYGVPPEKVIVTYCGAGQSFRPLPEAEKEQVRRRISGGAPYLLSVGALHPRKNLVRLLKAFEKFKEETRASAKLVLAGPRLFKTGIIFQTWRTLRHKRDVLFLGSVPDEQLGKIYGGAHALVFVSYFEGFGIPALEAMSCGVPVVAGNRTSLPEVCEEAALLVDPFSIDAIAGAMKSICLDDALRQALIKKGEARKNHFSWDKTASLLWEAIERSL